jgi:acyl-CoA thioester hydrolase
VRYSEVDRMGYLWHGHYLALFEEARTDWLRARGLSYKALEDEGTLLVVAETGVKYLRPGQFEDLVHVWCAAAEAGGATLRLEYEVWRDRTRLATGWTLLASTDRRGRPCRLPEVLRAVVPASRGGTAPEPAGVQAPRGTAPHPPEGRP